MQLSQCSSLISSGYRALTPVSRNAAVITTLAVNILIECAGYKIFGEAHIIGANGYPSRFNKIFNETQLLTRFVLYDLSVVGLVFLNIPENLPEGFENPIHKSLTKQFGVVLLAITIGNIGLSIINGREKIKSYIENKLQKSFENNNTTYIGTFFTANYALNIFKKIDYFNSLLSRNLCLNIENGQVEVYQYVKDTHPKFIHEHVSAFFKRFIISKNLEKARELFEFHKSYCDKNGIINILTTNNIFKGEFLSWDYLTYESLVFLLKINPNLFKIKNSHGHTLNKSIFVNTWNPNIADEEIENERLRTKSHIIEHYPESVKEYFPKINSFSFFEAPEILPKLYDIGYRVQKTTLYRTFSNSAIDLHTQGFYGPILRTANFDKEKITKFKEFIELVEEIDPSGFSELIKGKYFTLSLVKMITTNEHIQISEEQKGLISDLHVFLVEKGAPSGFPNPTKSAAMN
ncbi:MAG: hypothetical protein SNF33_01040 [Candidatus Algichlamydia australiensis]|nr:hypothetical protein [Chlamydiales bacterium]